MDRKLDASIAQSIDGNAKEDAFELKDILFYYQKQRILVYCHSSAFCFIQLFFLFCFMQLILMINKYHVSPNLAGSIPALLPFGAIFLTPIFGTGL